MDNYYLNVIKHGSNKMELLIPTCSCSCKIPILHDNRMQFSHVTSQ